MVCLSTVDVIVTQMIQVAFGPFGVTVVERCLTLLDSGCV